MISILRNNRLFYGSYACLMLIALSLLQLVSKKDLFFFFNARRSGLADFFYYHLSWLGDGIFFMVVILCLLFISYRWALTASLAYAFSSLVTQVIKRVVYADEPRPLTFFKGVAEVNTVEGVELHSLHSFPSGHTTTAFAIACLLSLMLRDKRWTLLFLLIAVAIGFSRIYLGQHFFADISAGSFIGVYTTTISALLISKINKPVLERSLLRR